MVIVLFAFAQCKKSGEKGSPKDSATNPGAPEAKSVKRAKPGKVEPKVSRSVDHKKGAALPAEAGFRVAWLPGLWNTIQKLHAGTADEVFKSITGKPVLPELVTLVTNPLSVGVSTTKHSHGAFFFGDEEAWKRSGAALKVWSLSVRNEKTKNPWVNDPANPYQKKLNAILAKAPWVNHRLIIPLADATKFARFVKTTAGRFAAKTCPIINGKLQDGVYITGSIATACPKLPGFTPGAPAVFAFNREGGIFAALRLVKNHARVDILTIPAWLKGFDFTPSKIAGACDMKSQEPPRDPSVSRPFTLSTRWQSFSMASTYLGALEAIAALLEARPDTKVELLKVSAGILDFSEQFSAKASFLTEGMKLQFTDKNELVIKWKVNPKGYNLFRNVMGGSMVPMNAIFWERLLGHARELLQKEKSPLGNLTFMKILGCGPMCTADCFNRIPLECYIPDASKTVDRIRLDLTNFFKMRLGPILPRLKKPAMALLKKTRTLLFTTTVQ
ncbi:hypothetical protein KKF84_09795 [Myxococcota bacterium]|nr:hypothetical protein [Myxococcota bacterium]